MANRFLLGAKAQFMDDDGTVLDSGTVKFVTANTSTLKDTYSDYARSSANANPVTLDSNGQATIFLGTGFYDIIVYDADGVELYTVEDMQDRESLSVSDTLIANGHFENVTGTDPDNWTYANQTGTIAVDSTDQDDGLYSLKFTSDGSGGGKAVSSFFPCSSVDSVTVKFSVKSSVVDVRNKVTFRWYDKDQTQLTGGDANTTVWDEAAANPTSWTKKQFSTTPPGDTRWGKVVVNGCDASDATAGSTWFDNVVVFIGGATGDVNVLSEKTASYEVTAADVADYAGAYVPVDASGGNVTITLPTAANYSGKHVTVFASADPGTNYIIINNNAAAEQIRGSIRGQKFVYTSDGTTEYLVEVNPLNYVHCRTALTASGAAITAGSAQTVILDEEVDDTGDNCSLASNQMTLAAGTYRVVSGFVEIEQDTADSENYVQLVNTTTGPTALTRAVGFTQHFLAGGRGQHIPLEYGIVFTVAASQALELQIYVENATAHANEVGAIPIGSEVTGTMIVLERLQ